MLSLRTRFLLLTILLSAPLAGQPYLVQDINQQPANEPVELSAVGLTDEGILYFAVSDSAHGTELWRTDGTEAGTWRLTDICPGRCSSRPEAIKVFDGQLYFSADDGFSGRELWRSNGTPGGERRVRDLCPGPCGSDPSLVAEGPGGALFFFASADAQRQLWRTDGSRPGTVLIAALCTPEPYQVTCTGGIQRLGDRMLFGVLGTQGTELWESDGTAAGTRPLRERVPGLPPVTSGLVAGDFLLFWTRDALWRTDGTAAGTVRIKLLSELTTPGEDNFVYGLQVWNGQLFSVLGTGELVRSDGTPEGTFVLRKLPDDSSVHYLTPLAGEILFVAAEDLSSGWQTVWRTRGTPETTEPVFSLRSDPDLASTFILDMAPLGGDRALFRVQWGDDVHIWVTDGTEAGTRRVDGVLSGHPAWGMMPAGDQVFFVRKSYYDARQLWRTDGTPAGSWLVKDFQEAPGSSGPLSQTPLGGSLIFSAQISDIEAPLFRSDGTPAGTRLLSEEAEWGARLTRAGGRVYFTAAEATIFPGLVQRDYAWKGLWSTDGTAAGTRRVSEQADLFQPFAVLRGELFFSAPFAEIGPFGGIDWELWKSNGTRPGTRKVKNINRYLLDTGFHHTCYGAPSNPGPGVVLRGRLFFAADDGRNGHEIWVTDGTRDGTRLFFDVNPRRSPEKPPVCSDVVDDGRKDTGLSSNPEGFVRLRDGALFTADDGAAGRELWWTDGTPAGARRVKDLRPGPEGSAPHDLVRLGDAVYFFASTAGAGERLWRTDGTAAGTVPVRNLSFRALPSWARDLTAVGDQLFFVVYNELLGAELWTSRGDAASTRLVVDLRPGAPGSHPQELTDAGGVLLFAATDGETGLEPWRSDGTAAGTRRLGDLNPGLDASAPGPFTRAGNRIFFGAWEPVHGREPWAIPLEDVLRP